MQKEKGNNDSVNRFERADNRRRLSADVFHPLYKKCVGAGRTEYTEDKKQKNIFELYGRTQDEKKGEKEECGKKILVESDNQTGVFLRELPIKYCQNGKSQTRAKSP